jgi:hypothetical protein
MRHGALAVAAVLLLAGCEAAPAMPSGEPSRPPAVSPFGGPSAAPTAPAGYGAAYCRAVGAFDSSGVALRAWGAATRAGDREAASNALTAARRAVDEMLAAADVMPVWAPAETIPHRLRDAAELRRRVIDEVTGAAGHLAAARRTDAHALASRTQAAMYRAGASWELIGGIFGTAPCPADPAVRRVPLGQTSATLGMPATWRTIDLDREAAAVLADLPKDPSPAGALVRSLVEDIGGRTGEAWLIAITIDGPPFAYVAAFSAPVVDPYQALADVGDEFAPLGSTATETRADFTIGPISAIRFDDDRPLETGAVLASTVVAVAGSQRVDLVFVLADLERARTYAFDVDAIVFAIADR